MLTDFCKKSTLIHGSIAISLKSSKNSGMFLVNIMQHFKVHLSPVSNKLTKLCRNNAVQLEYKNTKYFAKYEKLYEIIFICTCTKDSDDLFTQFNS